MQKSVVVAVINKIAIIHGVIIIIIVFINLILKSGEVG